MSKTPVSQTHGHSTALPWSRYGRDLIIDLGFKSVMFRKYQPQLPPSGCLHPVSNPGQRPSTEVI